jgi:hypothetical protein
VKIKHKNRRFLSQKAQAVVCEAQTTAKVFIKFTYQKCD